MSNVIAVLAILAGAFGAVWVYISVVRTVAIPRPERVWLTEAAFEGARRFSNVIGRRLNPQRRHQLLGAFAPTVLIMLPFIWSIGLFAAFASIYWGLGLGSLSDAVGLSASSLTTLGFVPTPNLGYRLLASFEALAGLAILALMISFLPTLYGTFSRREVAVGRLTTRAGEPPDPVTFIDRMDSIGQLDRIDKRWQEWEDWFVELGETHTTFPALIYFRSAKPERSWITASEMALDTAALVNALNLKGASGAADTMIRSGYLALRAISDFYRIEAEVADISDLSVSQTDFEELCDRLETAGISVPAEKSEAWAAFAGWRINYDRAIVGLGERVGEVGSHWRRTIDSDGSS